MLFLVDFSRPQLGEKGKVKWLVPSNSFDDRRSQKSNRFAIACWESLFLTYSCPSPPPSLLDNPSTPLWSVSNIVDNGLQSCSAAIRPALRSQWQCLQAECSAWIRDEESDCCCFTLPHTISEDINPFNGHHTIDTPPRQLPPWHRRPHHATPRPQEEGIPLPTMVVAIPLHLRHWWTGLRGIWHLRSSSPNGPSRARSIQEDSGRFGNRLGVRLPPQETRHGKLQRHCHLSAQLLPLHAALAVMHHGNDRTPQYHGTHSQFPPPQEDGGQILRSGSHQD